MSGGERLYPSLHSASATSGPGRPPSTSAGSLQDAASLLRLVVSPAGWPTPSPPPVDEPNTRTAGTTAEADLDAAPPVPTFPDPAAPHPTCPALAAAQDRLRLDVASQSGRRREPDTLVLDPRLPVSCPACDVRRSGTDASRFPGIHPQVAAVPAVAATLADLDALVRPQSPPPPPPPLPPAPPAPPPPPPSF